MVRVVKHKEMNLIERLYIFEAFRGLYTTIKHFLRGFFRYETLPTTGYPEVKPYIPRDYRAKHRMMVRPDGSPRCVACFMCASACPAHCIFIEAAQSTDGRIEKKASRFEIDHSVCIFCGLCVEACPVDALRMDTCETSFVHPKRKDFIVNLTDLTSWNPKDYPDDPQSQVAPGGTKNKQALEVWGEVKC